MENPATWDEATRVVWDALDEADREDPEVCGISTPLRITDALKASGFCLEKHD